MGLGVRNNLGWQLTVAVLAGLLALSVIAAGAWAQTPADVIVTDDHASGAAGATPVEIPGQVNGTIDFAGDRDFFGFEAVRGAPIILRTALGGLSDSTLAVLGEDGETELAFNDDTNGLASEIVFSPLQSGPFFAVVEGFGASIGSYTLSLEESSLTLEGAPRFDGATLTLFGEFDGGLLGGSAVGDFDGDGVPDLALGAAGAGVNGRVLVTSGSPAPLFSGEPALALASALSAIQIEGEPGDQLFGRGLAAGDLTGDGFDDLVVGLIGSSQVATASSVGTTPAHWTFRSERHPSVP